MPFKARSLNYVKEINYYTPQNDKFLGYTQFPRPRCNPYFNQTLELKLDKKKKDYINDVEKHLDPANEKNKTLFKYKNNEDVGVSHITGTLKDKKFVNKNKTMEILKERNNTTVSNKLMDNTVKIINNQFLKEPNLKLFDKKIEKINIDENKKKEKDELERQEKINNNLFDKRINEERY